MIHVKVGVTSEMLKSSIMCIECCSVRPHIVVRRYCVDISKHYLLWL